LRRRPAAVGLLALLAVVALLPYPVQAEPSPLIWRLSTGVRANLRERSFIQNEAVTRGEVTRVFREWIHGTLFGEFRGNWESGRASRMELGGELGFKPVDFIYIGTAVHQAWLRPGRDELELEVRGILSWPIQFLKIQSKPVKLYLLDEWTFNVQSNKGKMNEAGAGFIVPLPFEKKDISLIAGWRHVDRIHSEDSDQFEGAIRFIF